MSKVVGGRVKVTRCAAGVVTAKFLTRITLVKLSGSQKEIAA